MPEAAAQSTVLRFPTKRKRAYPNPRPFGRLPEGVTPITHARNFEATKPAIEPLARSPELAVMLAVISALTLEQRLTVRNALLERWEAHPEDPHLATAAYHISAVL